MHPDSWKGIYPHGIVLFGLLLLVFATIGILTGKAFTRRGRTSRGENPGEYWSTVVAQTFVGVFMVGYWAFVMTR